MISVILFLALFSSPEPDFNHKFFNPEIPVKWYFKKSAPIAGKYTVIVDTRKVNRYIQLSDIRFVVEFKTVDGRLMGRDTIRFIPDLVDDQLQSQTHLPGQKIASMDYESPKASTITATGIKLLYKWDDSSISLEPDPIEEKTIIPSLVYGEGSADISVVP